MNLSSVWIAVNRWVFVVVMPTLQRCHRGNRILMWRYLEPQIVLPPRTEEGTKQAGPSQRCRCDVTVPYQSLVTRDASHWLVLHLFWSRPYTQGMRNQLLIRHLWTLVYITYRRERETTPQFRRASIPDRSLNCFEESKNPKDRQRCSPTYLWFDVSIRAL